MNVVSGTAAAADTKGPVIRQFESLQKKYWFKCKTSLYSGAGLWGKYSLFEVFFNYLFNLIFNFDLIRVRKLLTVLKTYFSKKNIYNTFTNTVFKGKSPS